MERRDFIIKSGVVLTAAGFISSCSSIGALVGFSSVDDKTKRPNPDKFKQPILKAIALGISAPSPHNTQSWKFNIISDTEMELYVDENILLPATDPPSRQIHMGTGCFIETLVLGAERIGYKSNVDYFPNGYESEKDFGKKPVAKIKLLKSEFSKNSLSDFIETRQTNRQPYTGKIITQAEFNSLRSLSGKSHSKLILINHNIEEYFDLFFKAFEVESRTYRTNEETRNLFRFSEEQRAQKRDGISIPQMGYTGITRFFAERSLDNGNKEKWHRKESIDLSLESVKEGIESSKGFIVWYTESNTYLDWVKSGRDYVRFSLAMTKMDLYPHPYNQAIQEYDEMKSLRDQLNNKLSIKEPQKSQMIIRIGRCSKPYYSYRRYLNNFLIK